MESLRKITRLQSVPEESLDSVDLVLLSSLEAARVMHDIPGAFGRHSILDVVYTVFCLRLLRLHGKVSLMLSSLVGKAYQIGHSEQQIDQC